MLGALKYSFKSKIEVTWHYLMLLREIACAANEQTPVMSCEIADEFVFWNSVEYFINNVYLILICVKFRSILDEF